MPIGGSLAGVAKVVLRVDDEAYTRDLTRAQQQFKHTTNEIEQDSGRLTRGALAGSGAFHSLGRSLAFASGAFLGAAGFTALVRSGFQELASSQKVAEQTNTVLKSTGEVAGVSAGQVDALAQSLLRKSGVDDEVIKSGENVLLTFTNIRNVAGEGNDVFNQATKASLDLSVAMKQDLQSSVVQVGKALNDPIRGMTALQRIGVTFTTQQKEMVKQLVASGHTLDAQKLILRELNKEFGGSAEAAGKTLPGQLSILQQTFKNLEADLLRGTVPALESLVTWLQHLVDGFQQNQQLQADIRGAFRDTANTAKTLAAVLHTVVDTLGGFKRTLELLLALKVASTLGSWTTALRALIGTEAAASGLTGAQAASGGLLRNLRALSAKPFQVVVAYEVYRKLFGPIQNDAGGPGDLMPVYRDGKWVDPISGQPVADQAYWNRQVRGRNGTGKPAEGANAQGTVPTAGAIQGGLVSTAKKALGVPYQYGGAPSISKPTDCSGLMVAVFARNGITLPRTSEQQYAQAPIKDQRPLLPGDLVFAEGVHPGHVGLYIGDNQVLEDPHTGDHVKIVELSAFGWNGESARWWGGAASKATGGSSGHQAASGHAAPPQADPGAAPKHRKRSASGSTLTEMPADLHLELANAYGHPREEIKILEQFERVLEERKAAAKKLSDKGDIGDEINNVRDQIKGLRDKLKKPPGDPTAMPLAEQLAFQEAIGRNDVVAQIKILRQFEKLLEERKKLAKTVASKVQIQEELNAIESQVSTLVDQRDQKREKPIPGVKGLQATLAAFQRISSGERLTNLPGVGKVLLPYQPTFDDWRAVYIDLTKKLRAAKSRLRSLQRSLKVAQRAKHRNRVHEAHLQAAIATLKTEISDLQVDAGDALAELFRLDADARSKIQQDAGEAESDQGPKPPPVSSSDVPDQGAPQQSGPSPEEIQAQETAAANRQTVDYLSGLRALQSFEQNIASNPRLRALTDPGAAALAGATITIINNNQQQPEDPHSWSSALLFELRALVG